MEWGPHVGTPPPNPRDYTDTTAFMRWRHPIDRTAGPVPINTFGRGRYSGGGQFQKTVLRWSAAATSGAPPEPHVWSRPVPSDRQLAAHASASRRDLGRIRQRVTRWWAGLGYPVLSPGRAPYNQRTSTSPTTTAPGSLRPTEGSHPAASSAELPSPPAAIGVPIPTATQARQHDGPVTWNFSRGVSRPSFRVAIGSPPTSLPWTADGPATAAPARAVTILWWSAARPFTVR